MNSNGNISLEWERHISDDSNSIANLKPNINLDIEWNDYLWTANINLPMGNGSTITGPNISMKRDVSF